MNPQQIQSLLRDVAAGNLPVEEAMVRLRRLPFEQLPFATLDHHRALRCGHPEVIFCPGKTPEQVVEIARHLADHEACILATRASSPQIAALRQAFEAGGRMEVATAGGTILLNAKTPAATPLAGLASGQPHAALVSAGTADLPVAEEAAMTFRSMGVATARLNDVGVSGLHRLLGQLEILQDACAIVVIAGMEGALPSVVGGLVACPVYAVPTSIGYGASLGGLAALLGMLNSCSANVSVVNIDNGFGAAFSASLVCQQVAAATGPRPAMPK